MGMAEAGELAGEYPVVRMERERESEIDKARRLAHDAEVWVERVLSNEQFAAVVNLVDAKIELARLEGEG